MTNIGRTAVPGTSGDDHRGNGDKNDQQHEPGQHQRLKNAIHHVALLSTRSGVYSRGIRNA
jgi:hypothetical protein